MREIQIDASHWREVGDLYDALLGALGAPNWHGRNIAALIDSMIVGEINAIEPPYKITTVGLEKTPAEVRAAAGEIAHGLLAGGATFAALVRGNLRVVIEDGFLIYPKIAD